MADRSHAQGVSIVQPESPLTRFLQNSWWLPAAVLAVLCGAFVLIRQAMSEGAVASLNEDWSRFAEQTEYDPNTGMLRGEPAALASLAGDFEGQPMGAWVRLTEATNRLEQNDLQGASEALAALRNEHPDHLLSSDPLPIGEDGAQQTLVDSLAAKIDARRRWEESHPELFGLPDPPDGAPRVRITTSQGDIVIALYRQEAPETTARFVELVTGGFFDGQAVHAVRKDLAIELGDPHTKTRPDEPDSWGLGGQNVGVPGETNALKFFRGAVATAPVVNEGEESSSRFMILSADGLRLGGQGVVFGVVVEGIELAESLDDVETAPGSLRPAERIEIESMRVEAGS